MSKEVRCGDIIHDCGYIARGDTEEKVMEDVANHVRDVHNIQTISPDLVRKVKEAVHDGGPTLKIR